LPTRRKERAAQFLLQQLDMLADGGLREVQLFAGAREAAAVDRRLEYAKLMEVHGVRWCSAYFSYRGGRRKSVDAKN
jgi:hypothetical protein